MQLPKFPDLEYLEPITVTVHVSLISAGACSVSAMVLDPVTFTIANVTVVGEDPTEAYEHLLNALRAKDLAVKGMVEASQSSSSGSQESLDVTPHVVDDPNDTDEIPF